MMSYWDERIIREEDKFAGITEAETNKLLHAVYTEQAQGFKHQILDLFAKVEHDKATDGKVMLNDLYRNGRYWSFLNKLEDNLKKLGSKEESIITAHLTKIYNKTGSILDEIIPNKFQRSFVVPDALDTKQLIKQIWCADGKNYSDRIWQNKSKLLTSLKKSLGDFVVQGKSNYYIAQELADKLQANEANAYRLARTETAHIQNQAKIDKYKELGFTQATFSVSSGCCDVCKEKDGEQHSLVEFEGILPVHPNCRCTFKLIVDGDD